MGKGNLIVVIVLEYFDTSFVFSFPIGKRSSFSSFEYVCSPELVNGILSTMTPKFKNKQTHIHPKTIPESHYFSWKCSYLLEFYLLFNQEIIEQIDSIIKPILAVI